MGKSRSPNKSCIQLKADFLPLTVIKLGKTDLNAITSELSASIEKAPNYFVNAPIVIDVKDLTEEIDLNGLCTTLRQFKIIPVGIRGLHESKQELALNNGLAILTTSALKEPAIKEEKSSNEQRAKTKLVTKPVRAGTQVYAQDGDLVLLAAVNSGAEVIADGNIHVYGPLRGRALAGAKGNENARIFCEALDAELISIAGHYLVKEKINVPETNKPMIQIYLHQEKIQIEGI